MAGLSHQRLLLLMSKTLFGLGYGSPTLSSRKVNDASPSGDRELGRHTLSNHPTERDTDDVQITLASPANILEEDDDIFCHAACPSG